MEKVTKMLIMKAVSGGLEVGTSKTVFGPMVTAKEVVDGRVVMAVEFPQLREKWIVDGDTITEVGYKARKRLRGSSGLKPLSGSKRGKLVITKTTSKEPVVRKGVKKPVWKAQLDYFGRKELVDTANIYTIEVICEECGGKRYVPPINRNTRLCKPCQRKKRIQRVAEHVRKWRQRVGNRLDHRGGS